MKMSKKMLDQLIVEVIREQQEDESSFPALKSFRKLSRGITETDEAADEISEAITPQEFEGFINKIISVLRNMEPEQRREHLEKISRPFGYMNFQQFLRIQNQMKDSQDGKLGEK
jgi:hypothetical protein